jgi:rod shape-determining protein MreC
MQYLNFSHSRKNHSLQHGFNSIFKKIETPLFGFLCIVLLITSKTNRDFSKDVSFAFVNASLPVVKVAAFPFNIAVGFFANFGELMDAKKENEKLKNELEELKMFYVDSLNVYEENKRLREVLDFVTAKSSSYKMAKIIGRSNQLFNQKIFIDAGANKGIKEGSIVTANLAVIGRIEEVSENRSRLILLNDATSRIPIITSKARVRGILAGNGSNGMEILYLPRGHKIEVGDSVFTSGDGDTLPSGLFVGVVKKVSNDSALVEMAQEIANADIVTIIDYKLESAEEKLKALPVQEVEPSIEKILPPEASSVLP